MRLHTAAEGWSWAQGRVQFQSWVIEAARMGVRVDGDEDGDLDGDADGDGAGGRARWDVGRGTWDVGCGREERVVACWQCWLVGLVEANPCITSPPLHLAWPEEARPSRPRLTSCSSLQDRVYLVLAWHRIFHDEVRLHQPIYEVHHYLPE